MVRISVVCLWAIIVTFIGCVEISKPFTQLPPGTWRATLVLEDDPQSNKNDLVLPFNFEISYTETDQMIMKIINAEEVIEVKDISFWTDRQTGKDSVRADFPVFDTHISAEFKEDIIEGYWYVHYRDNYKIPFIAYHGQSHRFTQDLPADVNISGQWDVQMEIETETEYPAIGEFRQDGDRVVGTFMTETGDYRFLEGIVNGSDFFLSCFDGSHAFYFDGKVLETGNILGRFYSGIHYKTNWTGINKYETKSLSNPFEFSQAANPQAPVNFTFQNTDGEMIGPNSSQYYGKPKIIIIMGTWCPNCMDETNFITGYLKDNPKKNIDVIAIAFERYRDEQKSIGAIKRYKKIKEVPYEVLYGGYYDKKEASETFKVLKEIKSYPTLVFLDGDNKIRKIHTGFAGPATSEYENFVKEFDKIVTELLNP